nr:MAG TPA: hypothetical protein [Caudoviricetes sp.]
MYSIDFNLFYKVIVRRIPVCIFRILLKQMRSVLIREL